MNRFFKLMVLVLAAASALAVRAATNESYIRWNAGMESVSADVHHQPLWPMLEKIAHETGWHIFVEPDTARVIDVKFQDEPRKDALKKLLGDLNFAYMPKTNAPSELYVFTSRMANATKMVAPTNAPAETKKSDHVPNQLMVKLKPGADIDALAKAVGAKVVGRDDKNGIYLLEFSDEAATETAVGKLKSSSDVAAVDYNYLYNPPTPATQVADANPSPISLKLDESKKGDPCNPIIGLIDTRIQSLGKNLDTFVMKPISLVGDPAASNPSATAPQSLSTPKDPAVHQTAAATAGGLDVPTHATSMAETILSAISRVSDGKSAVKILPVDVYGNNETATTWNVALGVKAAVDGGATVLNMSLSGNSDSTILRDIIAQAQAQGVIVFAAAGNVPVNTPTFPAAIPGVNSVTALGAPGQLAPYANYGNFSTLALPGSSQVQLGDKTFIVNGTSPATAYASGIAAGLKGVDCPPWLQIQRFMQQKFPVPQKQN